MNLELYKTYRITSPYDPLRNAVCTVIDLNDPGRVVFYEKDTGKVHVIYTDMLDYYTIKLHSPPREFWIGVLSNQPQVVYGYRPLMIRTINGVTEELIHVREVTKEP